MKDNRSVLERMKKLQETGTKPSPHPSPPAPQAAQPQKPKVIVSRNTVIISKGFLVPIAPADENQVPTQSG